MLCVWHEKLRMTRRMTRKVENDTKSWEWHEKLGMTRKVENDTKSWEWHEKLRMTRKVGNDSWASRMLLWFWLETDPLVKVWRFTISKSNRSSLLSGLRGLLWVCLWQGYVPNIASCYQNSLLGTFKSDLTHDQLGAITSVRLSLAMR